MTLFFESLTAIEHFTNNLRCQNTLNCPHCSQNNQFISHGYLYQYQHLELDSRSIKGKRVICSNRYGRSGCGRTLKLFISNVISCLTYNTLVIAVFLIAWANGTSIQKAYQQATNTLDGRNGYRWIKRCLAKLSSYRVHLKKPDTFQQKADKPLKETINQFIHALTNSFPSKFQLKSQSTFI